MTNAQDIVDNGGTTSAAVSISKPIKLNIGAGGTVIEGFTPIDIKTGVNADKLPYGDGTVDEVYASHVLEHFPYERTIEVLREWARVLKPQGKMWIGVPDFDLIKESWNDVTKTLLHRVVLGGHVDEHDVHGAIFDFNTLKKAMHAAGIGNIGYFEPFANDTTNHPMSLNVTGTKRHWAKVENPKVCLVLSQPRISFTDHSERMIALAHNMKFNVIRASGAFWDRDIEQATKNAINTFDPDFLLYSDYDSVFDPADVQKLLETINNDPTLACVGAVQMSRHDDRPLVFEPHRDYSKPTTAIGFHHFGLTIIRADVFKEMEAPWFWSIPGMAQDGSMSWESWSRSDGDITFWRIMQEHGFRVMQHNEVVIGHMVLCVKWPKDSGSGVSLQPIENYNKHGKPTTAKINQDIYRAKMLADAKRASEKVTNG